MTKLINEASAVTVTVEDRCCSREVHANNANASSSVKAVVAGFGEEHSRSGAFSSSTGDNQKLLSLAFVASTSLAVAEALASRSQKPMLPLQSSSGESIVPRDEQKGKEVERVSSTRMKEQKKIFLPLLMPLLTRQEEKLKQQNHKQQQQRLTLSLRKQLQQEREHRDNSSVRRTASVLPVTVSPPSSAPPSPSRSISPPRSFPSYFPDNHHHQQHHRPIGPEPQTLCNMPSIQPSSSRLINPKSIIIGNIIDEGKSKVPINKKRASLSQLLSPLPKKKRGALSSKLTSHAPMPPPPSTTPSSFSSSAMIRSLAPINIQGLIHHDNRLHRRRDSFAESSAATTTRRFVNSIVIVDDDDETESSNSSSFSGSVGSSLSSASFSSSSSSSQDTITDRSIGKRKSGNIECCDQAAAVAASVAARWSEQREI